jgi:hypothetical protein
MRDAAAMFSYISPEVLVPEQHPLRAIRPLVNSALERLSPDFDRIYHQLAEIRSRRRSCCERYCFRRSSRTLKTPTDGADHL